ncbi:MAG TPA: hypothetical protein VLZ81_10745, partial [Blastocatellia bacterium]|nr:hypothetical protein [Blastocatellia bacterium]
MEENNNISGEASGEEAQVSEAAPADDLAQAAAPAEAQAAAPAPAHLRRRQEQVGLVTSDKMQKTVTVRV